MKNQNGKRITFGNIPEIMDAPDLLNIQLESWESFLQADVAPARRKNKGLQAVFKMNFPVTDARENFLLEFVEYYVEKPKYSVTECEERGLTYAVPIKSKLRLSQTTEDGKVLCEHHRAGCLSGQPADDDAPRDVHHQRCGARGCQPAPPVPRGLLQRVDSPERDADLLRPYHSLPRVLGGVRDRHQQRHVRLH